MLNATKKGETGEDFVNHIAFKSFVKYWCFPGPTDLIKDNKEICDLLVLFDDICMIISVKNYDFKGDYDRYFRRTIDKAIRQIDGAERKLFRNEPLLLKHPDRKEEVFEKGRYKQVHRIIVNLNEDVKYYQTSYHYSGKSYTVMDAAAWYTSMEELNTIPDFTRYLSARCDLFNCNPAFIFPRSEYDFSTNDRISAAGQIEQSAINGNKLTIVNGSEMDLISEYIRNNFKFPQELSHDKAEGMMLNIDGRWKDFQASKISAQKDDYEKESYFIDRLVKELLIHTNQGNHLAQMFFRLNRLDRSDFAKAFLKYHEEHSMGNVNIKINRSHVIMPFINMVFVYHADDVPKEEIAELIRTSLHHHHYLHKFKDIEVGALAISRTTQEYTFGYSKLIDTYTDKEINEMKQGFFAMGWQTKQLEA